MRIAKFLRSAWLIALTGLMAPGLFTSCGSDDDDSKPEITLEANPKELAFEGKAGAVQQLAVVSNAEWEVTSCPKWLAAAPAKGEGNMVVEFTTTEENLGESARSGIIAITAGDKMVSVTVSQAKAETTLEVTPTEIEFTGGSVAPKTVTVTTNRAWKVTECPEWVNVSPKEGTGNASVFIAPTGKAETSAREGKIVITAGDKSKEITISQESQYTNCTAAVKNAIVMSDSYYAELEFSSNTKGYFEAYYDYASIEEVSEQELYADVLTMEQYDAEYTYTGVSGISAGQKVLYCVIPFTTSSNGQYEYGPMTKTLFTAKSASTSRDALISGLSYTSTQWRFMLDMQKDCDYFYFMYGLDDFAESAREWTNAYLAYQIDYYVKNKGLGYHTEDGLGEIDRGAEKSFFAWTWGADSEDKFSGNVQRAYKSTSAYSSHKQAPSNKAKGGKGFLKPDKKLTRAQIEAHRKSLRVVKVAQ